MVNSDEEAPQATNEENVDQFEEYTEPTPFGSIVAAEKEEGMNVNTNGHFDESDPGSAFSDYGPGPIPGGEHAEVGGKKMELGLSQS